MVAALRCYHRHVGKKRRSPPEADDSAAPRSAMGVFQTLWRRLARHPERKQATLRLADEWRTAQRQIESIEATTPPLDGPPKRLEKLYAAMEADIARLRARPSKSAAERVDTHAVTTYLLRAREQIEVATEMLDSIADQSRSAAEGADEWERLAMLAVEAGSDELAREALARRAEMVSTHRRLQREVDAGRAVLAEMRAALNQLSSGVDTTAKR